MTHQMDLRAETAQDMWAALAAAGIADMGEDGPYLLRPFEAIPVGTLHVETGDTQMIDGVDYPVTEPAPGFWLVLMGALDADQEAALADLMHTPPRPLPRFDVPVPSPAEIAARDAARAEGIKAECSARILAVVDARTQGNIGDAGGIYAAMRLNQVPEAQALAQAGFVAGDLSIAAAFQSWRNAMLAHCRALIAGTTTDDWPPVPAGVVDLAERF